MEQGGECTEPGCRCRQAGRQVAGSHRFPSRNVPRKPLHPGSQPRCLGYLVREVLDDSSPPRLGSQLLATC